MSFLLYDEKTFPNYSLVSDEISSGDNDKPLRILNVQQLIHLSYFFKQKCFLNLCEFEFLLIVLSLEVAWLNSHRVSGEDAIG